VTRTTEDSDGHVCGFFMIGAVSRPLVTPERSNVSNVRKKGARFRARDEVGVS